MNDAYEVLSNPARRAAYDAALEWRVTAPPRPAPAPPPGGRPPHNTRPGPPVLPRRKSQTPAVGFDLRPYAGPIRWLGRALLAFGLLLLLDYGFLYYNYTTSVRVKALKVVSPDSLTTLIITRGRVTVYGPLPANILDTQLQVRSSLIFRFAQAAWLPNGQPLRAKPTGTSLPGFVYFMLALLSQWQRLSLGMRLNSLMLASVMVILILLILLRL